MAALVSSVKSGREVQPCHDKTSMSRDMLAIFRLDAVAIVELSNPYCKEPFATLTEAASCASGTKDVTPTDVTAAFSHS